MVACGIGAFAHTTHAQTLPHGVAAGDVAQTSVVLWARSTVIGPVAFELSTDADFLSIDGVFSVAVTNPDSPVKAEVVDLAPGTRYYYRATDAAGASATGGFRTPHESGRHGLRFGVSGDWRGELRPYPAIANMVGRDLDFFVALGDTIYADVPSDELPTAQARSIDEFRAKHQQVYSERYGLNSWADVRASTAIFTTIDDHEVTNDFEGGAHPETDARFDNTGAFINETDLYRAGLQAFHEYNPIREESYGATGEPRTAGKPRLYRFRTFGDDAAIFLLDARSFRDDALEEVFALPNRREYRAFLEASFDPSRTMLGAAQLADLEADLLHADALGVTWKFILVPEPIQTIGPALASDRFEGYAHERTELLRFIDENEIDNVVFVAADIHATMVNNLSYRLTPTGRRIPVRSFEITTGSVAFAPPFGPTVIGFAPPIVREFYERLGPAGQNSLAAALANVVLDYYGLSGVGLRDGLVDAGLLNGNWLAVNTYGWTEFEIDADSQCLTITTYGIPWYGTRDMATRPDEILARRPKVVSRFRVRPRFAGAASRGGACPSPNTRIGLRGAPCGAFAGATLLLMPLALAGMRHGPRRCCRTIHECV